MLKVIFGLTRKPELSLEAFRRFWLEDHAPKVSRLPKLRRYTVDIFADDEPARPCDGFATLWFDSRADFLAAFGSEYGRTVAFPNNAHFNDVARIVRFEAEEHEIRVDPRAG